MPHAEIYLTSNCRNCDKTKQMLDDIQLPYSEIFIDQDYRDAIDMVNKSGQKTVPQVFINNILIGGYDDMLDIFGIA